MRDLDASATGIALLRVKPGQRQPFAHRHNEAEEIYVVIAGSVEQVDRYRAAKLREGKLAPAQINKTLKRLSQILEVAEEYGHVPRNSARGKRRRVKAPKVQRSWVEPEQALSLVDGGSAYMRPVIATLIGAGLRVSEAVAVNWPDVNLATGTLTVGRAKTDAGS
jgi:integrase